MNCIDMTICVAFFPFAGLERQVDVLDSVGVFDGVTYRSVKSGSSWTDVFVDIANMLWRWGLDFIRLESNVNALLDNFDNFYRVQEEGKHFSTLSDFLDSATPDGTFREMYESSAEQLIQKKWGVSTDTYNQVVGAFSRVNYNQPIEGMNGFVMAVSLAGVQDGLWSVKGGNRLVCSGLLEKARADVRRRVEVVSVERLTTSESIQYEVATGTGKAEAFDSVILATPLQYAGIKLLGLGASHESLSSGQYCYTVVTFVVGHPRGSHFGLSDILGDFPDLVISSSNTSVLASTLGVQKRTVDFETVTTLPVWKIFSTEKLPEMLLDEMFAERVHVSEWTANAFPLYSSPPSPVPSFVLDTGVFYTSPIEWAASAMEMSALAGRNAALLANSMLANRCGSKSPRSGLLEGVENESCPKVGS